MRKLAPVFISTVVAFAAGNVLANDSMATDKTGSPTVSANKTGASNLSYSDKSNTSPGTNAKMDKSGAPADKSTTAEASKATTTQVAGAHDEDNKDLDKQASDKPLKTKKVKKSKVAHNTTKNVDKPSTMAPTDTSNTPPLSATKGEAVSSTTGKSAGQ